MKIFEIGVGSPNLCRCIKFKNNPEVQCFLFEPNPYTYKNLVSAFRLIDNFEIFNLAIADKSGQIDMHLLGDSSYVDGVSSPESLSQNIRKHEIVRVGSITMEEIDPGDIDILLLDMEGSEWYAIKNLKSRPFQIIVEMEMNNGSYKNPFYNEIMAWMEINNYNLTKKDEDYVFILKEKNE